MKKIILCASIIYFSLIMISCKSTSSATPTGALKAMAETTKKGDFKSISKLMCKADKEMMDKMIVLMEETAKKMGKNFKDMMKENMDKSGQSNMMDAEFKNEKVNGDNATVEVYNKKNEKLETITLKKEEGTWKICPGIADKASANMGSEKMEIGMKKAEEALKGITPEKLKQLEEQMKNVTPEQMEQAKKMIESMKKPQ